MNTFEYEEYTFHYNSDFSGKLEIHLCPSSTHFGQVFTMSGDALNAFFTHIKEQQNDPEGRKWEWDNC